MCIAAFAASAVRKPEEASVPLSSVVSNPAEIGRFQPAILGIRPLVTHPDAVGITNPELRKVAEDVVNALRLSLTGVVAKGDAALSATAGSTEDALGLVIRQLAPELRSGAQTRAKAMLASDRAAQEVVFGRFAEAAADASRDAGFRQLLDAAKPVAIDLGKLGISVPRVSLPMSALTAKAGSLTLTQNSGLQAALRSRGTDLGAAMESARGDFQSALQGSRPETLIEGERFAELWGGPVRGPDPFNTGAPNEDFQPQDATTDKLRLWVRSLRCNDETNPEAFGDDEMAAAGVSIDEDGDTKQIGERFAGSGYHDGVQRALNWDFTMFSLREKNYWPKKFGVTLIIAEKDNGGLSAFMQRLWNETRNAVHNALAKAAQAAGVAIGTFIGLPEFGPLIGQALAAAAQWIIDNVVNWLINLFKDDLFKPFTSWVNIPSMNARWNFPNGSWGNTFSPLMSVTYTGHGGQYRLNYQWQLYA
jgi:hypothetical protein